MWFRSIQPILTLSVLLATLSGCRDKPEPPPRIDRSSLQTVIGEMTAAAEVGEHRLSPPALQFARVMPVTGQNSRIDFGVVPSLSNKLLPLGLFFAHAGGTGTDRYLTYSYTITRQNLPQKSRDDRLSTFFQSPNTLRDAALAEIEMLRIIAREEITTGTRISVTEHSKIRVKNPPQEISVEREALPESVRNKLLEQIDRQLDSYAQTLEDHHEAIHSALVKAMPFVPGEDL